MKSLIVYYSHTGNNEALAKELKVRFGSDMYQIVEPKKRGKNTILLDLLLKREPVIEKPNIFLNDYETIIFVAPTWGHHLATPLKSFIKMMKYQINKYAFITFCTDREGHCADLAAELFQEINKKPMIVTELMINELLPPEKRNKIKQLDQYRIKVEDFEFFRAGIRNFVNTIFERTSELRTREPILSVC